MWSALTCRLVSMEKSCGLGPIADVTAEETKCITVVISRQGIDYASPKDCSVLLSCVLVP
jgi:hypothetical protein